MSSYQKELSLEIVIFQAIILSGQEGFARLRAGRVAALGRPRRPIHCCSLRSPLYFKKQTERLSDVRSVLAGEEGFARLRACRVAALGRPRRPIHCRSHRSPLYFKNRPNVLWTSDLFWQGKKASNPRPTVLETAALPAELFPCISFGGPSGTRTPDRPVMSRLLYQLS